MSLNIKKSESKELQALADHGLSILTANPVSLG